MLDKDCEFLLWIAKRLVYKYGENKEILDIVNNVIKKYGLIQNSYNSVTSTIINNLSDQINNCNQILVDINSEKITLLKNIHSMNTEFILNRFENLDIDGLLKK